MSDTPRTDAEVIEATFPHAEVVTAGFARKLEREQVLAHQRATRFEQEAITARETILTLRGDLHAERATNKVLFADVERLENAVSARPEVALFQQAFRDERVKVSYNRGRGPVPHVPTWTITFTDSTVRYLSGETTRSPPL